MTDRSPEDQAVFDRHPDIPQDTLDEDDFTSTVDAAAGFEAERAQNERHVDAHQHSFALQGNYLACYCGETVDRADVEP